MDIICDEFRDCVVVQIRNTNLVLACMYIPPENSNYYDDIYFDNLQMLLNHFSDRHLLIMGDLNSRYGELTNKQNNFTHLRNPDKTTNKHGRTLIDILQSNPNFFILNGLQHVGKSFDSNYTFHRGTVSSQVDIALSNDIDNITSLNILKKLIYSDHCPLEFSCSVVVKPDLHLIRECAEQLFSYDHYVVSRRIKPVIKLSKIDIPEMISALDVLAESLKGEMDGMFDENDITAKIENGIYDACKQSKLRYDKRKPEERPNFTNCTSKNFKAIAEINLHTYEQYIKRGAQRDEYEPYLQNWIKFEDMAIRAENEELNIQCNKSWKSVKHDSKKMWNRIDWKGKGQINKNDIINEATINQYFKKIFQSEKTMNNPVVSEIMELIDKYDISVPEMDKPPDMNELEQALKCIRRGASFDGLPPDILLLLPPSLKEVLLKLIQQIFFNNYPSDWNTQLLHAITKFGHTFNNPQLRGIAVAPLLCRVYDTIMDNRFMKWYTPNPEQSSQSKQGCPLPLFTVNLLIDYANETNRGVFVGFLDFEKAYDYVNRAKLLTNLMDDGCGKNYIRALAKMYGESSYAPKLNESQLGKRITTNHGVTQGRKSSGNLFTYYISDMPNAVKTTPTMDFLDPFNLLQLADDTTLLAEHFLSLQLKFIKLIQYSHSMYQVANVKKTVYAHFAKDPITTPIDIDETTQIFSIDDKGHVFLGMTYIPTNELEVILKFNLKNRMKNTAKFYGWLEVNENTPIQTKLLVLDVCVFGAMLNASESWGNISCIEESLVKTEMKMLKRILNVKKGTCNDLIYYELRRAPITLQIRDRQFRFFKKLKEFSPDEATVANFIQLCYNSRFLNYYRNLRGDESETFVKDMDSKIDNDSRPMVIYYRTIVNKDISNIYTSFINDYYRRIITRWRLSNHTLKIETQRYSRPYIPRENRVCSFCNELEDETHVIFDCPLYHSIRHKHKDLLSLKRNVNDILNPEHELIFSTANLLYDIENTRKDMKL